MEVTARIRVLVLAIGVLIEIYSLEVVEIEVVNVGVFIFGDFPSTFIFARSGGCWLVILHLHL